MLKSFGRVLAQWPTAHRTRLVQIAGRSLATEGQKPVDEGGEDATHFHADAEDFAGSEADVDSRARYNFDENHIEVTGIVRGPPRVYTMPTGRHYAIIKLSTTSGDRRGAGRFVSFVDVFAPNSQVDYIKEHIREGVQVYVSGQLRSRMRTDEDGRPFQDVRVQANGLFKIVDPKQFTEESGAAATRDADVAETKQSASRAATKAQAAE